MNQAINHPSGHIIDIAAQRDALNALINEALAAIPEKFQPYASVDLTQQIVERDEELDAALATLDIEQIAELMVKIVLPSCAPMWVNVRDVHSGHAQMAELYHCNFTRASAHQPATFWRRSEVTCHVTDDGFNWQDQIDFASLRFDDASVYDDASLGYIARDLLPELFEACATGRIESDTDIIIRLKKAARRADPARVNEIEAELLS